MNCHRKFHHDVLPLLPWTSGSSLKLVAPRVTHSVADGTKIRRRSRKIRRRGGFVIVAVGEVATANSKITTAPNHSYQMRHLANDRALLYLTDSQLQDCQALPF